MNIFIIRSMIIDLIIFSIKFLFLLYGSPHTEEIISKKYNKIFHFKDYLWNYFIIICICYIICFLMKILIHYPNKYVYLKIIDEDAKEFEKYIKKY